MGAFSILLILNICISYNDDIFAGGSDGNYLKDILRYNKNHTWEEVCQMKKAGRTNVVAVMKDVSKLCP